MPYVATGRFDRDLAVATVGWVFVSAAWFLPHAFDDPPPGDPRIVAPTRRAMLQHRFGVAARLADAVPGRLAGLAGECAVATRATWDTGELVTTKTPSTPADPADGFMAAVHKVLGLLGDGTGPDAVTSVSHGTTVATNQLLEDRIGRLGFVTTEGFEFLLEIARQSVPDGYGNSYFWVKPPRIVPAHLVRTVGGRLDHRGAEIRPFDEEQAVAVARWFRAREVTTVGVCFLHAYANPDHERRMRDVLAREHPECVVSVSSDVLREYREYERGVTTLVDAAVKPRVSGYVAGIGRRLDAFTGRRVPFHIMKSNGGVLSADEVVHQPITTVLSGPAAGALGAALVARRAGFPSVITLDGGGTSTDVAVVLDGEPTLTTEGSVGRYPSKIPMIDIVTVGAGGGSVAWISPEGNLKVGPRSAGADPGPLCYAKGGTEPTVTDAHVVLGRIPPHLLGGEIPLDVDAARDGLAKLAADLRLDLDACATGILEISAWNQANAIRQVTVKRGLDVREFTMTTFGGSGSLLACRLVDVLGLRGVVVPQNPGNVSAFGLLTVDVRGDYVQTFVTRHDDLDPATVETVFADLREQAAAALLREGFPPAEHRFVRTADLRYYGQAFEVRVPVPDGAVDAVLAARVADTFHEEHRRLYGYDFAGDDRQRVEWVNLRVTGVGPIRRPELVERPAGDGDVERARTGTRSVRFEDWRDAPVYWRPRLEPGDVVAGPAVVEEFGSTLPVHPGFAARVDALGNLVLAREAR
jgi:N-methylhydantoinase A